MNGYYFKRRHWTVITPLVANLRACSYLLPLSVVLAVGRDTLNLQGPHMVADHTPRAGGSTQLALMINMPRILTLNKLLLTLPTHPITLTPMHRSALTVGSSRQTPLGSKCERPLAQILLADKQTAPVLLGSSLPPVKYPI